MRSAGLTKLSNPFSSCAHFQTFAIRFKVWASNKEFNADVRSRRQKRLKHWVPMQVHRPVVKVRSHLLISRRNYLPKRQLTLSSSQLSAVTNVLNSHRAGNRVDGHPWERVMHRLKIMETATPVHGMGKRRRATLCHLSGAKTNSTRVCTQFSFTWRGVS